MYFVAVFLVLPSRNIQKDLFCETVRKPFENVDICVNLIVTLGLCWSHGGGKLIIVLIENSVVEGDCGCVGIFSVSSGCDGVFIVLSVLLL